MLRRRWYLKSWSIEDFSLDFVDLITSRNLKKVNSEIFNLLKSEVSLRHLILYTTCRNSRDKRGKIGTSALAKANKISGVYSGYSDLEDQDVTWMFLKLVKYPDSF